MRVLSRLLVVAGCGLAVLAPAAALAAPGGGGLRFAGPADVSVTLHAGKDVGSGKYGTTLQLLVENDGPRIAPDGYAVRGFFPTSARQPQLSVDGSPPPLQARGITPVPVVISVEDNSTASVTVQVRATGRSTLVPAVETITLHRLPTGSNFKDALWVALSSAGLTFFLQLFARGRGMSGLRARVNTQKGWTFAGNWATNFAALFTALGAVLSATAVLTDLIPGVDISLFAAVAIGYAVLMASAPLIATAFRKQVDGVDGCDACVPGFALVGAGALAVCAVAGQLATIGALANLSDLATVAKVLIWISLGGLWALIVFGADQSLANLRERREPPPAAAPAPAPPHFAKLIWRPSELTARVTSLHPALTVRDWWHAGDGGSRTAEPAVNGRTPEPEPAE